MCTVVPREIIPFLDKLLVTLSTLLLPYLPMPALEESAVAVAFRRWLEKNDAYLHPSLYFAMGEYGSSVFTSGVLESDTMMMSCPMSLIITPENARDALELLASTPCPLDDREVICTYLVLHTVVPHRCATFSARSSPVD